MNSYGQKTGKMKLKLNYHQLKLSSTVLLYILCSKVCKVDLLLSTFLPSNYETCTEQAEYKALNCTVAFNLNMLILRLFGREWNV